MKIIISHIFTHYMTGRTWKGLDANELTKELTLHGFEVAEIPFTELINHDLSNSVLFYSAIYNAPYLQYIKDTVTHLQEKNTNLIIAPSLQMLNSLNNKGYQEYLKERHGISTLKGKYYGDFFDFYQDESPLQYPFVWKTNEGALSSGVKLINSLAEMKALEKNSNKQSFKGQLAQILNKKNSFKKDENLKGNEELFDQNFTDFFSPRTPFVTQQFIPNLTYDWKVLTFGSRMFFVKRFTRENDFRASGSGKVFWEEPTNEGLTEFVNELINKLNHPFLSLDIGEDDNNNYYLFELQGVAFGPLTTINAPYFYEKQEDIFEKKQNNFTLEQHYAHSLMQLAEKTSK